MNNMRTLCLMLAMSAAAPAVLAADADAAQDAPQLAPYIAQHFEAVYRMQEIAATPAPRRRSGLIVVEAEPAAEQQLATTLASDAVAGPALAALMKAGGDFAAMGFAGVR